MIYRYIFEGVVHPKRVNFGVNGRFAFQIERPEFGINGGFNISFQDSEFRTEYVTKVDHTKDEKVNLETLRNYIDEAIRIIVDIYCYVKSYTYEIEIINVKCPELHVDCVFDVQGEKNIHKDKVQTDREFINLIEFFSMRPDLNFFNHVLADFRRSIKYPSMTGFFCYRSIETIRRFYFEDMGITDEGKRRQKGWEELRKFLGLDRGFFQEIENFALANRHGEYPIITYQQRELIMNKTRNVIDSFIGHITKKTVDDLRLPDGRKQGKISKIW